VDQEVAKTLAELELKLRELERELMSIGRRATEPSPPPPPPSTPPEFQRTARAPAPPPSRLVDEAVETHAEQRYSLDTQETAFGEIPASKDERETIELGELVRFKEEMQQTLQGLIDEYSRLLSLRPRSGA
jgi:hypothetical protein